MTVIAWDGQSLAADRAVDIGGISFEATKVRRVRGETGVTLMAFAGSGARFNQCVEWFNAGANPETYPKRETEDHSVLVCIDLLDAGAPRIRRYEATGYPLQVEDKFYADGAGRDVALAALHCGKSAREAVVLAIKLLGCCGKGIDVVSFD